MTYWSPEASTAKVRLARISHEVKRGAVGRETEAAVGGCVLPGRARRLPRGSKGDETGRRLALLRENRAAPLGVETAPISADNSNSRLLLQPSLEALCGPAGQ